MIYFVRYDNGHPVETASCEDEQRAAGIEARGFALEDHAAWRAARRELETEARLRIAREDERAHEAARRARARGEPLPPLGFTKYVI